MARMIVKKLQPPIVLEDARYTPDDETVKRDSSWGDTDYGWGGGRFGKRFDHSSLFETGRIVKRSAPDQDLSGSENNVKSQLPTSNVK